jgi:PI4KB/PIK1, accessory (PIK) domain
MTQLLGHLSNIINAKSKNRKKKKKSFFSKIEKKNKEREREMSSTSSTSGSASAGLNVGSLLRLFKSGFFDSWITISYLYKYPRAGVHDYLVNELYKMPDADVEFYIFQLCSLLVNRPFESNSLERFVMDKCSRSVHFATQIVWILEAAIEDNNAQTLGRCQQLREDVEISLVNSTRPNRLFSARPQVAPPRRSQSASPTALVPLKKSEKHDDDDDRVDDDDDDDNEIDDDDDDGDADDDDEEEKKRHTDGGEHVKNTRDDGVAADDKRKVVKLSEAQLLSASDANILAQFQVCCLFSSLVIAMMMIIYLHVRLRCILPLGGAETIVDDRLYHLVYKTSERIESKRRSAVATNVLYFKSAATINCAMRKRY